VSHDPLETIQYADLPLYYQKKKKVVLLHIFVHLFKTEILCIIINVFTVTFDQFNASLLNRSIKKISLNPPHYWQYTFYNRKIWSGFSLYLFFVRSKAEHSQRAAGSATDSRGQLRGRGRLGRRRCCQRLNGYFIAKGVREVLLHLLLLSLLDVVLCRVFQVSLNLGFKHMTTLVPPNVVNHI